MNGQRRRGGETFATRTRPESIKFSLRLGNMDLSTVNVKCLVSSED